MAKKNERSLTSFEDLGTLVYSTADSWQKDSAPAKEEPSTLPPEQQRLRVQYSRAGRGGKEATLITGFVGSEAEINALARLIKQTLGCGGSTRNGDILIQGNKKEEVISLLRKHHYTDIK